MTPSEYSVAYADALNRKFPDYTYEATAGRKFDRIVEHDRGFKHVHAFVERETGGLIKAATWKAPQRNPRTGLLAIRHSINTLKGMEAAVKAADRFGSYLYVRR